MSIDPCACGTFAIGRCKRCRAFVCGSRSCSAMVGGARVCSDCITREHQAAEAEQQAASDAKVAEHRPAIDREADALRKIEDPYTRALETVSWATTGRSAAFKAGGDLAYAIAAATELTHGTIRPDFWTRPESHIPLSGGDWWDSEAIGKWLAPRVNWDFVPNYRARANSAPTDRLYILGGLALPEPSWGHWRHDDVVAGIAKKVGVDEGGRVLLVTGGDHGQMHRKSGRAKRNAQWSDHVRPNYQLKLHHLQRIAWAVNPAGWGSDGQLR